MFTQGIFRNSSVRGGGRSTERGHRWLLCKKDWRGVVCNSMGFWGPQKFFLFSRRYIGLHFVRFLKQIFGYTALAWYVYVNITTRSLTCLA